MALADRELIARLLDSPLDAVLAEARGRRDARQGAFTPARMTYSPKVFIPLTRLCTDVCHYCTFATTPSQLHAPYLTPEEVLNKVAAEGEERLAGRTRHLEETAERLAKEARQAA